jgi:hypothetical protein
MTATYVKYRIIFNLSVVHGSEQSEGYCKGRSVALLEGGAKVTCDTETRHDRSHGSEDPRQYSPLHRLVPMMERAGSKAHLGYSLGDSSGLSPALPHSLPLSDRSGVVALLGWLFCNPPILSY